VAYLPRDEVQQEVDALETILLQALTHTLTQTLDWQLRTTDYVDDETATGVYLPSASPRRVVVEHASACRVLARQVAISYAQAFLVEVGWYDVPETCLQAFWAQWAASARSGGG
jgi:hypothetical protein